MALSDERTFIKTIYSKNESVKFYRDFRVQTTLEFRRPASSFPSILIGRRAKVGHHGF
jgi:hypothetical protein